MSLSDLRSLARGFVIREKIEQKISHPSPPYFTELFKCGHKLSNLIQIRLAAKAWSRNKHPINSFWQKTNKLTFERRHFIICMELCRFDGKKTNKYTYEHTFAFVLSL